MLIKKMNDSTFDVFWNKGWESWARIGRKPDGTLSFIKGKVMPTKLFQQFKSIINKKNKGKQIAAARAEAHHHQPAAHPTNEAVFIARFQK